MKTIEIIGYPRETLGKQGARRLRQQAHAPCVLYGGASQRHFYTPMALLRDLVYTPNAHFVDLTIGTQRCRCIMQEIQFHPVSEVILHVDFLEIFDDKPVKMDIPTKVLGNAPGVAKGGTLAVKLRSVPVVALPAHMPEYVEVDVSMLDLGQIARVRDVVAKGCSVLASPTMPLVAVEIPRALRSAAGKASEDSAAPASK